MKLKLALASATALGLVMTTAAFADENKAYLTQDGTGNQASITQNSGATSGNQAGSDAQADTVMSQSGSNNVLTILQTGDDGEIGIETRTDFYYTPESLAETPPTFQFDITFHGVNQTSTGGGSNEASLTQHGNGSIIGDLRQTAGSTASGNDATATQTGANTINHIWQTQDGGTSNTNVINATQSGSGNVIDRIDQRAMGAGSSPNTINVDISGTNNGAVDLTGTSAFYSSRAWFAGATPSALIQNKHGNLNGVLDINRIGGNAINLEITGSDNQYGMTQKGIDNTTGTVSISGTGNMFGSYQAGQGNVIGAGEIAGDNNDTGIWQIGSTNSATVSVLDVGSNSNQLSILQQGTTNVASVSITGSFNGEDSFEGVAGNLVSGSGGLLGAGTIAQGIDVALSHDNTANLTIFGNDNAFAISSLGSDNNVTGNIGTGSGNSDNNSAAVLQNGDGNTASFTQTGGGTNSVAISQ